MKKRLYLVLSLALVLSLGLTACGKEEKKEEGSDAKDTETSQEAESSDASEQDGAEEDGAEEDAVAAVDIDEIVVVDNDECKITINGVDPDNMFGYTINALYENKTSDKKIMFTVDDAFINGVYANPLAANEITAGKKENVEILLSDEILKNNGLTEYTDIELAFRAYNSDDWDAPNIAEEAIHIYPLGEDKASVFSREAMETDTVLVDNDYATVIVTGYSEDELWGYSANLYIVNKSDKVIMFSLDECSVDGMMIDPLWAHEVDPGKQSFTNIQWSNEDFEANKITVPKEIEFKFTAHDSENFGGEDFINEVVKLNP